MTNEKQPETEGKAAVDLPHLVRIDPIAVNSCNADRWLLGKGVEWVCYLISIDEDETATYLTWQGVCEINVPAATAKNGITNYLREGWKLIEPNDKLTHEAGAKDV